MAICTPLASPPLPILFKPERLSTCPCVCNLAMVCFPIGGTNTCVLDAMGSSGRGVLVAEGRSRRRGVVRSSLALLPPAIREMSWTHRGRAVCTVLDPGPTAGVPGATMPPGRVSPQPPHFCCSTTSQGQYVQMNQGSWPPVTGWHGSGAGGGPGTMRSAPLIRRGAVPFLLSTQCLKLVFLLVFCWDSSRFFLVISFLFILGAGDSASPLSLTFSWNIHKQGRLLVP